MHSLALVAGAIPSSAASDMVIPGPSVANRHPMAASERATDSDIMRSSATVRRFVAVKCRRGHSGGTQIGGPATGKKPRYLYTGGRGEVADRPRNQLVHDKAGGAESLYTF